MKKCDYSILFITSQASKGWNDAISQFRNAVADAWDALTASPELVDGRRIYALQGDLGTGTHDGTIYVRYQYKVSDGARIWYFVDADSRRVLLEAVHVGHPKATE